MTKLIDSDHLSLEIQNLTHVYSEAVKDAVNSAGEESIEFCNSEVTKNAKDQAGSRPWAKDFSWMKKEAGDWSDYIKEFKTSKTKRSDGIYTYRWYVGGSKYRLTHLLERSHQLFVFGRPHGVTKAYPHISPAVEKTERHYMDELQDKIQKAGYKVGD